MIDYNALIARVITREGGATYTDYGTDEGGPTKYGITLVTLHAWRKTSVSADDVASLTETEAVAIYRSMFFPSWYELVPQEIAEEFLFDDGVNAGTGNSGRHVQSVLQHWKLYDGAIDGDVGPKSAAALAKVTNWGAFFYAVKCERLEMYLRQIGSRPINAANAAGWANRSDQFELPLGVTT